MKNAIVLILIAVCIIIAGYFISSQCAGKKKATHIRYTDELGRTRSESHIQVK